MLMEIFYILLVLLITARVFAEIAVRLGQPELLGEIVAGIVLGLLVHYNEHLFPILSELEENTVFAAIKDLGIFFLLLMGGIELRPQDMAKASKGGIFIGCGGILLPFLLAWLFGTALFPESPYKTAQILFLGTALSVTAVPVAIKVLYEMGKLDSAMGKTIVSAAVIDDVLSLILLAMLTSVIHTGSMPTGEDLVLLLSKVALFFMVTSVVGLYVFPAIGSFLKQTMADEFEFSMLLTAAFSYAILAEVLGMHFILGAFQAGLFFRRSTISQKSHEDIQNTIKGMTNGFLAPIFFISVGLHLDFSAFISVPLVVLSLLVIAILGKVFGAGLAARWFGFSWHDASAIGVAMNARGAVELVIADIALRAGVFAHPEPAPPIIAHLFSAVVIMAVVTTVITPPLLRLIFAVSRQEE
jgi:Kef-type K+ transport system membrane component KefB